MLRVMDHLGVPIPQYSRSADPLLRLATPLHRSEPAPRCRLTRPGSPSGGEAERGEEEERAGEAEMGGDGWSDDASSPARMEEAVRHPAERSTDRLAASRSPTQSPRPPEAYLTSPSSERRVEERRRAQGRSAAPGRPAECAVSPQSPPLRIPETGSLLRQTLLAGRPTASAAGPPPESAAQRRWTDLTGCVTAVTGCVTAVTSVTGVVTSCVTSVTGCVTNGVTVRDVTAMTEVTCAVTELRDALVQTDPIDWREEEFTVVESLEEGTTCSSGER